MPQGEQLDNGKQTPDGGRDTENSLGQGCSVPEELRPPIINDPPGGDGAVHVDGQAARLPKGFDVPKHFVGTYVR